MIRTKMPEGKYRARSLNMVSVANSAFEPKTKEAKTASQSPARRPHFLASPKVTASEPRRTRTAMMFISEKALRTSI